MQKEDIVVTTQHECFGESMSFAPHHTVFTADRSVQQYTSAIIDKIQTERSFLRVFHFFIEEKRQKGEEKNKSVI